MPIIRRTRVCTAGYGVLHWLCWLWLCGAGTRAVCTVRVTVRAVTLAVHTARVPAPHNHSQHNQCRTPNPAVHTLVLLMMGIMMPETCWDRSLITNIRLVASCRFLSLHPIFIQWLSLFKRCNIRETSVIAVSVRFYYHCLVHEPATWKLIGFLWLWCFPNCTERRVHKKRRVARQVKRFHLDPEGVMPCSQEFASRICSEPFETGPQHHGIFLKIRFNPYRTNVENRVSS